MTTQDLQNASGGSQKVRMSGAGPHNIASGPMLCDCEKSYKNSNTMAANLILEGNTLYAAGDLKSALSKYEESLALQESSYENSQIEIASALNNIGLVNRKLGKTENAMECYIRALNIKRQALGNKHGDVAVLLHNIGSVHADRKEFAQAIDYFGQALQLSSETLGGAHIAVANTLNNIGIVHFQKQEYAEAEICCSQALEIYRNAGLSESNRALLRTRRIWAKAKCKLQQEQGGSGVGLYGC